MSKKQSIWGRLFAALTFMVKQIFTKEVILNFLKTKLVKLAITRLCLVAGWQIWLVTLLTEELFERVLTPAMELAYRSGKFKVDVHRGNVRFKVLTKAKGEHDEDTWNTIIDDM